MWYQRLLLVVLSCTCVFAQVPVKVTVFYETLCSDSVAFIANQLKPAFDAVGPTRMAVDFVPYGKATHSPGPSGLVFSNQHGHAEYQGNKMHACAIAALTGNAVATVNFVACGMSSPNAALHTNGACFTGVPQVTKAKIQQCYDGGEGDGLLASHGDRTHALVPRMSLNPNMGHVPRVEINGVYNANEEQMANNNLQGLICSKLQGTSLQCNPPSQQGYGSPFWYPSSSPQPYPTPAYNPYPGYPAYNPYTTQQSPHNYPGYPGYNPYPTYQTPNGYPGYPQTPTGHYPNYYPGAPTTQAPYTPYPTYPTYPNYPGYGGYPSPQPQPQPQPLPEP